LDDSLRFIYERTLPKAELLFDSAHILVEFTMYNRSFALDKATFALFSERKNPMFFPLLFLTSETIMIEFSLP
jgi:hypothetical protein